MRRVLEMVASSDDNKFWYATKDQAFAELKHLQDSWTYTSPGVRANGLKHFAHVAALSTGDPELFPSGRKGGKLTPNEFFVQLNDVLERWNTLTPSAQEDAMRHLATAAVVTADSMEVGSELATLRKDAQNAALAPLTKFYANVVGAIRVSNAVLADGAKKMAGGAALIAYGVDDVVRFMHDQGTEKIVKGLELCAEGAKLVSATLALGYTAALAGFSGVPEKAIAALDTFAAMCTKAIATVKSLDASAMGHQAFVAAITNAVGPAMRSVNEFCKNAAHSLEHALSKDAVHAGLSAACNATATVLSSLVHSTTAMATALADGFGAASQGMSLGDLAQSAAKNADALSNTLNAHVNSLENQALMQSATKALGNLSTALGGGKKSFAAEVDQAALKEVSADFVDAVNAAQDGKMTSLNQSEVSAAQGQQQSGGRSR
ncbi:hypothetical protein [Anaplasma capra]|uniref:hypothetical protein n=1 Tax=Anaplasma capra TaxID=1562740 RepID=UPI0021D60B03|nr:hypothetical protein [Anaplasma capra]